MRLRVPALLLAAAAIAACGDGGAETGPTACEVGPDFYSTAVWKLTHSSPACSSDDDCVRIKTDLACSTFEIRLCGTVVHKAVANNWDEATVCEQIKRASRPDELSCTTEASCAAGRVACVANECTSVR